MKRWTPLEDTKLLTLHGLDWGADEIACELDRSPSGVADRLWRLGASLRAVVRTGPWSESEDMILQDRYLRFMIMSDVGQILNRTANDCRKRMETLRAADPIGWIRSTPQPPPAPQRTDADYVAAVLAQGTFAPFYARAS
jgi:hypothetical protein